MNCELIGLSIDSLYSHLAWTQNIKEKFGVEISFPIIEDIKMDVARAYGMVHPGAADTQAVRATFFIDPNGILRAMVYYPMSNGRDRRVRAPAAGHADQRRQQGRHARRLDAGLRRDRAAAQDPDAIKRAGRRLQDHRLVLLDQVAVIHRPNACARPRRPGVTAQPERLNRSSGCFAFREAIAIHRSSP
jgi:hypothetical protein